MIYPSQIEDAVRLIEELRAEVTTLTGECERLTKAGSKLSQEWNVSLNEQLASQAATIKQMEANLSECSELINTGNKNQTEQAATIERLRAVINKPLEDAIAMAEADPLALEMLRPYFKRLSALAAARELKGTNDAKTK